MCTSPHFRGRFYTLSDSLQISLFHAIPLQRNIFEFGDFEMICQTQGWTFLFLVKKIFRLQLFKGQVNQEKKTNKKKKLSLFNTLPMKIQMKFGSPQNISGASQQNSVAAVS